MIRGLSVVDVPQDEWREAVSVSVDMIDDLDVFDPAEHFKAIKRIRDMIFMLVMLGYGQPAQEVASWFLEPSRGAWLKPGLPFVMSNKSTGLGLIEVVDARCSIDGQVTFAASFLDDDVEFVMTWDRFLLSTQIDIKEAGHEG